MGYAAVKGGEEAIECAEKILRYQRLKGGARPLTVKQIEEQLYLAVDRVMGEGSLYAPELAALAIKQAAGDTMEASFILRAYRTTKPRFGCSIPETTKEMRIARRISAAFKDVPGGQILGATSDYTLKLLDFDLKDESPQVIKTFIRDISNISKKGNIPDTFPKVAEILRKEGLLVERKGSADLPVSDITRESMIFPASRSATLQAMARGETGGLLLLAYSNMRGYGDIHPTIGELRVGFMPLKIIHPHTGEPYTVGEVKVTEAEVIARLDAEGETPKFTLGYGLCFGHNEVKAISMAVLDRAMQTKEPEMPSENQEFVLSHIDGIESTGFCSHYKLPHYVTFQSDLDRLRKVKEIHDIEGSLKKNL